MRDTFFSHQIWCSIQFAVCRYPSTSKIHDKLFLSCSFVDRIRWRNKQPETPDLYFCSWKLTQSLISFAWFGYGTNARPELRMCNTGMWI